MQNGSITPSSFNTFMYTTLLACVIKCRLSHLEESLRKWWGGGTCLHTPGGYGPVYSNDTINTNTCGQVHAGMSYLYTDPNGVVVLEDNQVTYDEGNFD